jgi:hypothetical protein
MLICAFLVILLISGRTAKETSKGTRWLSFQFSATERKKEGKKERKNE